MNLTLKAIHSDKPETFAVFSEKIQVRYDKLPTIMFDINKNLSLGLDLETLRDRAMDAEAAHKLLADEIVGSRAVRCFRKLCDLKSFENIAGFYNDDSVDYERIMKNIIEHPNFLNLDLTLSEIDSFREHLTTPQLQTWAQRVKDLDKQLIEYNNPTLCRELARLVRFTEPACVLKILKYKARRKIYRKARDDPELFKVCKKIQPEEFARYMKSISV